MFFCLDSPLLSVFLGKTCTLAFSDLLQLLSSYWGSITVYHMMLNLYTQTSPQSGHRSLPICAEHHTGLTASPEYIIHLITLILTKIILFSKESITFKFWGWIWRHEWPHQMPTYSWATWRGRYLIKWIKNLMSGGGTCTLMTCSSYGYTANNASLNLLIKSITLILKFNLPHIGPKGL